MLNKLDEFYKEVENINTTKTLGYSEEIHYLANLFLAWFNYNKESFIHDYPKKISRLTIGQCRSKVGLNRPYLLQDDFNENALLWQQLVDGIAGYRLNDTGELVISLDKYRVEMLVFGFYRQCLGKNFIDDLALCLFAFHGCEMVIEAPIKTAEMGDKRRNKGINRSWSFGSKINSFWKKHGKLPSVTVNRPVRMKFHTNLSDQLWRKDLSQPQQVNEIEYSTDEDIVKEISPSSQSASSTFSASDCGCSIQ